MKKHKTLFDRIADRIGRKHRRVFLREDFADLGSYDQTGRVLRELVRAGRLVKIGYGLYAKAKPSALTGEIVPVAALPELAKEALNRLGIEIEPSRLEKDYNAGKTAQVPTGRLIAVKGRIRRKIVYAEVSISFETAA